jgi:hypothetical protein
MEAADNFSSFTSVEVDPTTLKDLKVDEREPIRKWQRRRSRNGCSTCKKKKMKVSVSVINLVL